jgi:hypothetical protein
MSEEFVRLARLMTVLIASVAFGACKPSEQDREREISVFLLSLARGTNVWHSYVPVDKRDRIAGVRAEISEQYEIRGWDDASICCSLRNDLYEYQIRFANGREAVSYLTVERGRVAEISLEIYEERRR